MRVMVTGVAGFVGSATAHRLLDAGDEVLGVDNMDDYYAGKDASVASLRGRGGFEFERVDVNDPGLEGLMDGVDAVLHLAAQAGVRISVRDPMRSHHANATGTLNVLLAAKAAGVTRVVSASSSSVYGNAESYPVDESMAPMPISPYAASKLCAEMYVRQFHELYGMDTLSMRYFTVYGPGQRPDMAIRIFTEQMLSGEPPVVFGSGEQERDFTFIDDVVRANVLALRSDALDGGPVNVCCGSTISVNDLIAEMASVIGYSGGVVHEGMKDGDVDVTWGSNQRAKEVLGWEPEVPIREGVARFITWYSENRHGLDRTIVL